MRVASLTCSLVLALGGCRSDPTPARPSPPASADAMPTLPFEAFLPELDDRARREELYARFVAAEREAKPFAATPDRWVVIHRVRVGASGAKWTSDGTIELAPSAEAGTLFHEIFHTAYSRSVFHAGADEAWGEAFCDAFRYAAERELLGGAPSAWVQKLERYMTMSYDEVMAKSGDRKHDQKYAYPASLVIARAGRTLKGLRALWRELGDRRAKSGADVLDATFGYSPPR